MKDRIKDLRIKSRFILEVRHEPVLELFDKRGNVIKDIHPNIKEEYPFWRVEGNNIIFYDSVDEPVSDAVIGVKKFGISMEDRGSIVDFRNYLDKFIYPVYNKFKNSIVNVNRIGFRIISVLRKDEESFEEIKDKIISKTCRLPITKMSPTDYKMHIIYENGFYIFGPVKPDEPWLREIFRDPIIEFPGYGMDVDTSVKDLEINTHKELERAILALIDVSMGNEEQLAIAMGLADVSK